MEKDKLTSMLHFFFFFSFFSLNVQKTFGLIVTTYWWRLKMQLNCQYSLSN